MEDILIVGSSGHAKVVIDIIEAQKKYRIAGLIDAYRKVGEQTLGYSVIGKESDLPHLTNSSRISSIIIAVGDNFARSTIANEIGRLCPHLQLATAIHPTAYIAASAKIGPGTVVMAGASVGACCSINECCIMNTNSSLDHDSAMGNFSSLAPNCATGGNCVIGEYAAIGIGAAIAHNIEIGDHTVIGAGATVLRNVESFCVAYGTPAKIIRKRHIGERYL